MLIRIANRSDATDIAELYDLVWSQEIGVLSKRLNQERRPDKDTVVKWTDDDIYFVLEAEDKVIAVIGVSLPSVVPDPYRMSSYPENYHKDFFRSPTALATENLALKRFFYYILRIKLFPI